MFFGSGGFGGEPIEPISFDNNTLDTVSAEDATWLNGLYQYEPLFWHKTFDRFIPWEERNKVDGIWSCVLFCSPMNTSDKTNRLSLVHMKPDKKKHLFYLLEFRNEDVNSPIVYARSKFRKERTYRTPFVTVTAGGQTQSRNLPDVYLTSAWAALRFDTPLKWGVTVFLVVGTVLWWRSNRDD